MLEEIKKFINQNMQERELMFHHYMKVKKILPCINPEEEKLIAFFNLELGYIEDLIKENNKESSLLEDMRDYIEWMRENKLLVFFYNSKQCEEFASILSQLTFSSIHRCERMLLVLGLVKDSLIKGPDNTKVYGTEEDYSPMLSDEKLEEFRNKIPNKNKKH